MPVYRLIKIVPAASLMAAIKSESKYPVEEGFQDKVSVEPVIGFDINA